MTALYLLGCAIVIAIFFAQWVPEHMEAYREIDAEKAAERLAQQPVVLPSRPPVPLSDFLIPPDDLLPEERRHVSTTINYETGEITEKWTGT